MATLLMIEDSRVIRTILRKALEAANIFTTILQAGDGREGLEIAKSQPVDLILCDLEMPVLDGFGFLQELRADPRFEMIPVLMLSSTDSADKKVQGFALGASDYIVKPCDPAELNARVRAYLRLKMLQDELQEKNRELSRTNEELHRMAITDALTGLFNRRHFLDRAEEELARARRHDRDLGMLMLDIDFFKKINDQFGHHQGDVVLVTFAETLRTALRTTDIVARLGGEEFAVCLPETNDEGVVVVAEKLRGAIERTKIVGMDRPVTSSIGAAAFPITTKTGGVSGLLKAADEALYRAKGTGRNRVCLADPQPSTA